MSIKSLALQNIGPFKDVSFTFDDQINVLTGPNNCGKTAALMALADICVFPFSFPPKLLHDKGAGAFSIAYTTLSSRRLYKHHGAIPHLFGNTKERDLTASFLRRIGFSTFVPALRWSTGFRSESPLASRQAKRIATTDRYYIDAVGRHSPELSPPEREETNPELRKRRSLFTSDPYMLRDNAVVQKIIELDYRAYRQHKPGVRHIIERIATIASDITEGFPLEFEGVSEDARGLYPRFRTPDGDLPLDVLSQGTQSLIQGIANLVIGYSEYYDFPSSLGAKSGIVIIDEIDAHLHPSWQRKVLPTIVKHFPALQLFCSTHSPLMLAGLRAGQVQLMCRDKTGRVSVTTNDANIEGWTSDEILRGMLGVSAPTDIDTVELLERLKALRAKSRLSIGETRELNKLRRQVHRRATQGPVVGEVKELAGLLESTDVKRNATHKRKRK